MIDDHSTVADGGEPTGATDGVMGDCDADIRHAMGTHERDTDVSLVPHSAENDQAVHGSPGRDLPVQSPWACVA
ncbi:hypothetical protein [Streptomyces sp. NPDC006355]|uniref:hypothetical protein n=1 Tax=Streptomyces sp. NPDC006355 TaxID=3156758 RepID=UPI0033A3D733